MRSGRCTASGRWTARTRGGRAVMSALKHPSAGVRRNAVQVLPRGARSAGAMSQAGLLNDPDAQVRLAALWPGRQPPSDEAARRSPTRWGGLARNDRWLADAATAAAAATTWRSSGDRARPAKRELPPRARGHRDRRPVAEHYARGGPAGGRRRSGRARRRRPGRRRGDLAGLARGWPKDRPAKLDRATRRRSRSSPGAAAAAGGSSWAGRPLGRPGVGGAGREIAAIVLATAQR